MNPPTSRTIALCLLTLGPCVHAQTPDQAAPNLVFEAGAHDIEAIIDRAARYLKRNYLIDAKSLENCYLKQVQLQNPLALNLSNCEDMVSQLAFTCGLVLVATDPELQVYEWIAIQGPQRNRIAAAALSLTEDEVLRRRRSKLRVVTAVRFEHSNANMLVNSMRPVFMNNSEMMLSATESTIIVNGYADQVAAIIDLVRRSDCPAVVRPEEQPTFCAPAEVSRLAPRDYVSTLVPVQHLDPTAAARGVANVWTTTPGIQQAGMPPPAPLCAAALGRAVLLFGRQRQVAAAIRQLAAADTPSAEEVPAVNPQLRALAERIAALEKAVNAGEKK